MAAGRRPQATLEVELEQVLGVEARRDGRELAFGQELGGCHLAAVGVVDQHGAAAEAEGVLIGVGWICGR